MRQRLRERSVFCEMEIQTSSKKLLRLGFGENSAMRTEIKEEFSCEDRDTNLRQR